MDFNPGILHALLLNDLSQCSLSGYRKEAASALTESIFKKWIPQDPRKLEDVAIDGFLTSNARCQSYVLDVETDPEFAYFISLYKAKMWDMFQSGPLQTNVLTLGRCLQSGRAGPGASRATRHTDFFHKMFAGRLSSTSVELYYHYIAHISPRWQEAERARSQLYQVDIVSSSKLSTVPKNARTNRTICTEPSLNMFYQLGAGSVIEELLMRYHNIDTSLQPDRNREMARVGSINGAFATIDLSSASDTISLGFVQAVLPPLAFSTLKKLRCGFTEIRGVDQELNMISSMGNGFTFPLQTLLFATLVTTVYEMLGITPMSGRYRNYSVFGDDIICVKDAYDTVCRMLSRCGFIVNSEKSYNEGSFRESCGQDFFEGHDIRGVYLKGIENEQDVYSAFNRLCRWSAKHYIDISSTLSYLKGLVKFQPVPFDAGDGEGIKCPSSLLTRYSGDSDRNGARYYRATTVKTVTRRVKPAYLEYHYDGAVISTIGGFLRDQSFTPRVSVPELKIVKRRTPRWDYVPDVGLTIQDLFYTFNNLTLWEESQKGGRNANP